MRETKVVGSNPINYGTNQTYTDPYLSEQTNNQKP
jgi:hypothetical protein